MPENNYQRAGSISNAHVGRDFEAVAKEYFSTWNISLNRDHAVSIGWSHKKTRRFDLGCSDPPIIVECKSHRWTAGDNVPSAKLTVWNEAMYYFHLAPSSYLRILFVLKDYSFKRSETLAEYYIRCYGHLIPDGVEIFEFDPVNQAVNCLHPYIRAVISD